MTVMNVRGLNLKMRIWLEFQCTLLLGKIFATSFTIGSGGSAGKVIPSLYIGALSGCIISGMVLSNDQALHHSLVVVGMSASLSAIGNVPMASMVMIIEMLGLELGISAVIGALLGYIIGNSDKFYQITHDPHHKQICEHFKSIDRDSG